jgi:hypothetical protein
MTDKLPLVHTSLTERARLISDGSAVEALKATTEALGAIMDALGARKFLAAGVRNAVIRAELEKRMRTDEQLVELAAKGFEVGALMLAVLGVPGATAFSCNPSEEPP